MPTTYALVTPTPDNLDLQLKKFTAAQMPSIDLVSSTKSADGLSAGADYVYNAGPAKDQVTVSLRINHDPKKVKTSASVRLSASIRETVSETGAVRDIPVEAGVFWNYDSAYLPDSAAMMTLVQMAMALVCKDLTGANGTPLTNTIDSMDRRVLTGVY